MAIIITTLKKIKEFLVHSWIDELLWFSFIILLGMISFSLGALYERHMNEQMLTISIESRKDVIAAWESFINQEQSKASFFASRNGEIVYPIDCKAGNRVKEENRVYFHFIEQAIETGYRQSSQCS